jgi:hypothetical protein
MSSTRNPYYQLPGGADLPGDVRVSDTADASKTAAGGWAASPAAVAGVAATIPELKTVDFSLTFSNGASVAMFSIDNKIIVSMREVKNSNNIVIGHYSRLESGTVGIVALQYGTTPYNGNALIRIWYYDLT